MEQKKARRGIAQQKATNVPMAETSDQPHREAKKIASMNSYRRNLMEVLELCDVIVKVLDARDPLSGRIPMVEDYVLKSGGRKRLVFVLAKIDLIPQHSQHAWLSFLRRDFPTIPFRAPFHDSTGTSVNDSNASHMAESLLNALKGYAFSDDIKQNIRVGIVGYPNVGKSSLINCLKRSKTCKTSSKPGSTDHKQQIRLDKHVILIDSPGVVFDRPETEDETSLLVLRNCLDLDKITDVISPIATLLTMIERQVLMDLYEIASFTDVSEFLALLAHRLGRLRKGGIPDIESAARRVLLDWNTGVISHFTLPPVTPQNNNDNSGVIVGSWSKELNINNMPLTTSDK